MNCSNEDNFLQVHIAGNRFRLPPATHDHPLSPAGLQPAIFHRANPAFVGRPYYNICRAVIIWQPYRHNMAATDVPLMPPPVMAAREDPYSYIFYRSCRIWSSLSPVALATSTTGMPNARKFLAVWRRASSRPFSIPVTIPSCIPRS